MSEAEKRKFFPDERRAVESENEGNAHSLLDLLALVSLP